MSHQSSDGGFTLVEMLVVLAIIGIVAVLIVPRLTGASSWGGSRRELQRIRDQISEARSHAQESGSAQTLPVDKMGGGVGLTISGSGQPEQMVFYADGSCSGGAILKSGRTVLTVDALTCSAVAAKASTAR